MPKITNEDRSARIERVLRHLQRYPDGLKTVDLCEALGFEERTLRNYLYELEQRGLVWQEKTYWYPMSQIPITLRKMDFEAEEAMVLYLAARLFVKHSDKRNLIAENVLMKLSEILSTDARLGDDLAQAALQLAQRDRQHGYEDIFRTIIRGYINRRCTHIVYQPYRGDPFETIIHPYLLEPSAIGFSTYIIGYSSAPSALRTYKVERILKARIVPNQSYTIPDDFPGLSLLKNAWSIYYGEETISVHLRFHPDVAQRIQETNWHPSQQPIIEDPDKAGYFILQFEVADLTDLTPWIRTWGANCEVLAPSELRDAMTGEARRLAELYGWDFGKNRKRYSGIFDS